MTGYSESDILRSGVLTIDLDALAANYRMLRERAAPAVCAGVVKANAYGLGLEPVVTTLLDEGCGTFFVALPDEAQDLRRLSDTAAIYVLDGLMPGTAALLAGLRAGPVLNSLEEIDEWAALCRANGAPAPAGLHFDTGINRLGLTAQDAAVLAREPQRLEGISLGFIMSHFAVADEPAHPMNAEQIAAFSELREKFPQIPACLANSGGIVNDSANHFYIVRACIALYGSNPLLTGINPFRTVAHVRAPILQIRDLPAGARIGYGASFTCRQRSRIATIATGYVDGYFRALGAGDGETGADIWVAGSRAPVVGRVSMDMITADLSGLDEGAARRGDMAELLGDHITVDELANRAGTIGYEVLTSLGSRYRRVYIRND